MNNNKHVLLAVSGSSPAIITETIYGIYKKDPSKVPEQIVVITTQAGQFKLEQNFLGKESRLQQLIADYNLPPIQFTAQDILVPRDDQGEPLTDVQTERDQEIMTDFITDTVRALTSNPNITIHASLAGGRKTMGFALGYAMSLFGRPQDCLTHVLVSAPYENVPDFYYPTPTTIMRADRNHAMHDISKATISLAKIPLVLMREEMPTDLINKKDLSYTETVERINRANQITQETAKVELDFDLMAIRCDGQEVLLSPDCFAFYSWMAQDSKENPQEGILSPKHEKRLVALDARMESLLKASVHPTIPLPESLSELIDEVKDYASRAINREKEREGGKATRINWQFKQDITPLLEGEARDLDEVRDYVQGLWDRLSKKTKKEIEKALGKKLAEYYQITTVSETKAGKVVIDHKGLNIQPDNIIIR